MYSGNKLPEAEKFAKKRKKLKLWHRLLMLAGSVVVFITTYMLILPAITAEIGTLDVYLSEDSVLSGSAVIEEAAGNTDDLTESTTEATTEKTTEEKNTGTESEASGSGSSESTVLPDGTVVNFTLEGVSEEKSDTLLKNVFSLASTLSSGLENIIFYGDGTDKKFVAVYDPETGDFNVDLNIDFVLSQASLAYYSKVDDVTISDGYTMSYSITLPAGVILPDKLVYNDDGSYAVHNGYRTNTTEKIFEYYFVPTYDEAGNIKTDEYGHTIYTVVMVFDETYLASLSRGDIEGTMNIHAYLSSDYYTSEGSIIITDELLEEPIEIKYDQIKFNDNETVNYDVTVSKSGSYNSGDKTITYEVLVLTQKGTGDTITITDTFGNSDFITDLSGKLESVNYQQLTNLAVCINQWDGTFYTYETENTQKGDTVTLDSTSEGTGYYYDESGNLIITLPGLSTADEVEYSDWMIQNGYENYNAYIVTYTYSVDPQSDTTYTSDNTAKVGTYDSTAQTTIYDASTVKVTVSGKNTITKDGAYNSETEIITWTITVGDGEKSVNGYILTDDMFAGLEAADLVITDDSGNEISSISYKILYDDDGTTIKGIEFTCDEDDITQYTVTYKTTVSQEWASQNITNEADLETPDGVLSDSATVWIGGLSDCFTKTFDDKQAVQEDKIYLLSWTTTFNIPKSGIPAGITFTDYLEGTGHYMTAAQAIAVKNALTEAWGEGVISDIQFYTGDNRWNMQDELWVNAENIDESDTESKYYQFRYTIAKDVVQSDDGNNTITYSYVTTADVESAGYVNTITYYNSIQDSQTWTTKSDKWTYYTKVIKYGTKSDGSIDPSGYDTTDITVTDGVVSWIVRVLLEEGETYTITDTLPEGVTLSGIYASVNSTNCNNQLATQDGVSIELKNGVSGTVNVTYKGTDGQNVTVEVTNDATNENLVYIKYVCQITKNEEEESSDGSVAAGSDATTYELFNHVAVTKSGETEYGSDDQTTTVTWQDEDNSSEVLEKSQQFDKNNNVIKYSLNINPTSTTYVTSTGETYSDLVINDVLTYYSYPSQGVARDASLILNSVALYYAQTDEDGNALYDEDGNILKGDKLSSSEYTWTYKENITSYYPEYEWGYDYAEKTIKLTVPNGTALVFEYEFLVTIIVDDGVQAADKGANVTNSAEISVGGETIKSVPGVETKDQVDDSGTSASAHGASGYTIYKVDEDNFSLPLENAKFDLYVWSEGVTDEDGNVTEAAGFKYIDSFTTSSTGYTGITGALKEDADTGERYYEITLSEGELYKLPVDTICYFVESSAPDGYKTDTTKYYFYYGSSVAKTLSSVLESCGYNGDETITSAKNLIMSYTQYITNAHSWDYYAEKTSISVIKRWVDSEGNAITKDNGSISFNLYRVFTDVDGVQGYGPDYQGTDQTDTGSTVKLNWTEYDKYNATADSGSVTCNKNSTVKFNMAFNSTWYPYVLVKDANGKVLAYAVDSFGNNYSGMSSDDVTVKWETAASGGYTLSFDISIGESKEDISIYVGGSTDELSPMTISIDGAVEESTTESTTEATTAEAETESTTTAFYYHVFNKDTLEETDGTEISHIGGDYLIYKGSDDESVRDANYFNINGSLSKSHGSTYWDINGDGTLSSDELLETCLKWETNYDGNGTPTNITFTAAQDGLLTLVFNTDGNGSESSTITNSVNIDGEVYSATYNTITAYLTAGEHTLTRSSYCFLFYMSYEEGAAKNSSAASKYIHNFNDGTNSTFYTITGDIANNKDVVNYDNIDISNCLKMNSKANISFTTEEAGTLYMIFTNPNDAPVVGAIVDDVTHYAAATGKFDNNGNEIYEMTVRVSEGTHTIKRINSTEVMLYYIEYVPDDFGSGELTKVPPYNEYAELVGTYTISADSNWSWSNTNLLWQVLSEDGDLLGYYSYYIVEVDTDENYITQYMNNSSDGIESGSMAIYNQDMSASSTSISVVKNWLDTEGNKLSNDEAAEKESIAFDLYARVTIYDDYKDQYDGGMDYSRYFTDKATLDNDSDGFFTVSGSVEASSSVGEVFFTPTTLGTGISSRYYLKFNEDDNSVSFTSPATSGILTLTTYDWSSTSLSKGIGYTLTSPSGKTYKFKYSDDETNGLSGECPGTLSNAVHTLAADDSTLTITPTSSSKDPSGTGLITFTIFTDEAGKWTITRNGAQEYLLYMDFSYQYQYLIEGQGIYINSYTIGADDDWNVDISGLPYIIYDDDGVTKIGYYSYYVVETSPSEGYNTTIAYTQDADHYVSGSTSITAGTATITNQEKVAGVTLPETGGVGTKVYTIGGALLLCCAAYLLYIKKLIRGD